MCGCDKEETSLTYDVDLIVPKLIVFSTTLDCFGGSPAIKFVLPLSHAIVEEGSIFELQPFPLPCKLLRNKMILPYLEYFLICRILSDGFARFFRR